MEDITIHQLIKSPLGRRLTLGASISILCVLSGLGYLQFGWFSAERLTITTTTPKPRVPVPELSSWTEVVVPGTKRLLGYGSDGQVFSCRLATGPDTRSVEAVLKTPRKAIRLAAYEKGNLNQLWRRIPVSEKYFHLESRAKPGWVLEYLPPDKLTLNDKEAGLHTQHWQLKENCLVSRESGVALHASESGLSIGEIHHRHTARWKLSHDLHNNTLVQLIQSYLVLTFRISPINEKRFLREVSLLSHWAGTVGIPKLLYLVTPCPSCVPEYSIVEKLGKPLSWAWVSNRRKDSVLRDIQTGKRPRFKVQAGVKALIPVASFLQILHKNGFAFNDMHGANLLEVPGLPPDRTEFRLIDLGDVRDAGGLVESMHIGDIGFWGTKKDRAGDADWAIARDWLGLGVHLLTLLAGRMPGSDDRSFWNLVGSGDSDLAEYSLFKIRGVIQDELAAVAEGIASSVRPAFQALAWGLFEGEQVELYSSEGSDGGRWDFLATDTSGVQIRNRAAQLCLEMDDVSQTVRLAHCGRGVPPETLNQLWQLPPQGVWGQILNRRQLHLGLGFADGRVLGVAVNPARGVWRWDGDTIKHVDHADTVLTRVTVPVLMQRVIDAVDARQDKSSNTRNTSNP